MSRPDHAGAAGRGLVLVAGTVHTMDAPAPSSREIRAVGIRGDRVVAVGAEADVRAVLPEAPVADLSQRAVVPGFTDGHCHWLAVALSSRRTVVPPGATLDEVVALVAALAEASTPGAWIAGRGWDQSGWERWPHRTDLDAVAPENPVVLIRKDGHVAWSNSAALAAAGITAQTSDPPGGAIDRDGVSPAGILRENAVGLVMRCLPEPSPAERRAALAASWEVAWRAGLTGVHDMGYGSTSVGDDVASLREDGRLGLRVVWYAPRDALAEVTSTGHRSGAGDAWARFGGLKVFLDGTLGAQTAAMLEPYSGTDHRGLPTLSATDLENVVARAHAAGIAVAAHAIGDAAVRTALDHLGRRGGGSFLAARDRIEHVQAVHASDLRRFAARGVVASVQPIHLVADAPVAERFWSGILERAYPWRSLVDAGAPLVLGSDAPVEQFDVLPGLRAATMPVGWHTLETLTMAEALYGYTAAPAQAVGQGDELGSLAPGKAADLVVLAGDPFAGEAGLAVEGTMLAGRWAWRSPALDVPGEIFTGAPG